MADESQALSIARNHATDKGRSVALIFGDGGQVEVLIGEHVPAEGTPGGVQSPAHIRTIAKAPGYDVLETLNRAIAEADTFVHARDNAKRVTASTPAELRAAVNQASDSPGNTVITIEGNTVIPPEASPGSPAAFVIPADASGVAIDGVPVPVVVHGEGAE